MATMLATTASLPSLIATRPLAKPRSAAVGRSRAGAGVVFATLSGRPPRRRRRLARFLLTVPSRVERYFEESARRRWKWRFTSFGSGFFAFNMVSLTFGTLAVNDVLAAFVTLFFYETVTRVYYKSPKGSYWLQLLNWFKIGFFGGIISDCCKLGAV